MSKFIISAYQENELYVNSIHPEELLSLSDKIFCSQYSKKSKARIIETAKIGEERNFRLILTFRTRNISFQLQSSPITSDQARKYGFEPDKEIEKYEEIGEMLRKMEA